MFNSGLGKGVKLSKGSAKVNHPDLSTFEFVKDCQRVDLTFNFLINLLLKTNAALTCHILY